MKSRQELFDALTDDSKRKRLLFNGAPATLRESEIDDALSEAFWYRVDQYALAPETSKRPMNLREVLTILERPEVWVSAAEELGVVFSKDLRVSVNENAGYVELWISDIDSEDGGFWQNVSEWRWTDDHGTTWHEFTVADNEI